MRVLTTAAVIVSLVAPLASASSQEHHAAPLSSRLPTQGGQDAFAAISELVRMLEADPRTDWSRVNLEALRQHLIDMNQVVLRSAVSVTNTAGGATFTITAPAPAGAAIMRMITMHARELDKMPQWRAVAAPTDAGAVLTVSARSPTDATTITRIRGLGFIGLLATGEHHREHHLEIATGQRAHAGHH